MKSTLFSAVSACLLLYLFGFSGCFGCLTIEPDLDSELDRVADLSAQQIVRVGAKTVAIAPFSSNLPGFSGEAYKITNKYKAQLSKEAELFFISDRSEVDRLLEEQNLKETGMLLDQTVTQLGSVYGINAVIRGNCHFDNNLIYKDKVTVFVEVINLENGSIMTFDTKSVKLED